MRRILSLVGSAALVLLGAQSAFAESGDTLPTPRLVSTTENSATLEWDAVASASGYLIQYGTATGTYDQEAPEATGTTLTVDGLVAGTTYYMVLLTLDKDGIESDVMSEPLTVSVGANQSALAVSEVVATDSQSVTVTFSKELGNDPVTVKLVKVSDASDIGVDTVVKSATDAKSVVVTTIAPLDASSSYRLTVLSATSTDGATIAAGVDGFKEFATDAALASAVSDDTTSVEDAIIDETDAVDLNAAPVATGAVATAAAAATELPATGPAENLMLLVALMIAGGIFYLRSRRA